MRQHWQEAQERRRKEGWGNFIVTPDGKALIAGTSERGWAIVTSERCLNARTPQGVALALEELGLPLLGWL